MRFSKNFSIRALLILVTLASLAAAGFARPLYNYRQEQQVLKQMPVVTEINRGTLTLDFR